ncbi:hypothetical protein L9F63_002764, partial [Diploptera punctata]
RGQRICSAIVLSNYRRLWLKMCFFAQDFGHCMGLTFGGQTLFCFILQIICVYSFLLNVKDEVGALIFSGMCSVLVGILIFLQCNSAHRATEQ